MEITAVKPEEEALFINEFTPTKAQYVQSFRMLYWGSWKKTAGVIVCYCAFLLLLAGSRLMFGEPLIDGDNARLYVLVLALAALQAALFLWLPVYSAKQALRQQQEGYGRPASLKTLFTEEGVHLFNAASKGEMHFAYDVFTRCMETKELLLIKTESKQTLLLLKAGFVQGNEKELKTFIQKKCPHIWFSWKKA